MNLKQPVAKVLITSLDSYKVGLYQDTITQKKVLSFKEYGINIPGDAMTGTPAAPLTPVATTTLMTGFTGSKSCTSPGEIAFQWVEIEPPCPCGTCGWEYGLSIVARVKNPGTMNDWKMDTTRSYSGGSDPISCSGTPSVIDDAYQLAAEQDLIEQIANDNGLNGNNTNPATSRSMSPVEARRVYVLTELLASGSTITITLDGTAYPITTTAPAMSTCHTINNTATLQQKVMAFSIEDDNPSAGTDYKIAIMSRNNGDIFTVAIGGTLVQAYRGIALNSKSADVQFSVVYDSAMGATTTKHTLAFLTGNTTVGAATTIVNATMSGVVTSTGAAVDSTTDATYATNIQAAIAAVAGIDDDVACSYDAYSSMVYVYGSSNVSKITFTFSATSTASVDHQWSGSGSWPQLTGKDVFAIFANQKDAGCLANFQYLQQPDPDATYCMYDLKFNRDIYAIHGASHTDHYLEHVQVYMLSSILTTSFLDSTNPAATTASSTYNQQPDTNIAATAAWAADTGFEALLQIWSGVAVTSW